MNQPTLPVTEEEEQPDDWTLEIKPRTGLLELHLDELWRYRDLIMVFVRRDLVPTYKQTILGPLWFVLQPLFTTLIYAVIFGAIARISTNGVPPLLFYMSGIVLWNYFNACFFKSSATFSANASIFGKVYFPRLVMPVSGVISSFVNFLIQLGLLLIFLAYYKLINSPVQPNLSLLWLPVLLLIVSGLGLGLGIIVASLTTKYRDLTHFVAFATQLLMYATPIIYPVSSIPEKYRPFILANPLTSVVEAFRYALLGAGSFNAFQIVYSATFALVALLVGIVLFNQTEKSSMDTI